MAKKKESKEEVKNKKSKAMFKNLDIAKLHNKT